MIYKQGGRLNPIAPSSIYFDSDRIRDSKQSITAQQLQDRSYADTAASIAGA